VGTEVAGPGSRLGVLQDQMAVLAWLEMGHHALQQHGLERDGPVDTAYQQGLHWLGRL